jgi:peroxiredoxin
MTDPDQSRSTDAVPGQTDAPARPGDSARMAVRVRVPVSAPVPSWRRRLRVVVEIGLFLGVYFAMSTFQERHLLATDSFPPNFTLASLDGSQVSLDSLHGKRVVLHFWATWCGVCRQEFGTLNAIRRNLAPDEAIVTVVVDGEDRERIRDFVAKEHIQYPVLLGNEDVVSAFRVAAFPTNYFLSKAGRITGHTVGMSTRVSLAAHLALAR